MGSNLAWTGLALMLVSPVLSLNNAFVIAGAIILVIGVVIMWLGRKV
jgi:membrane-bound ClpP family serine protease